MSKLFKVMLVSFVVCVATICTANAQNPLQKMGQNAKSYVSVTARAETSRAKNELRREAENEIRQGINQGINKSIENNKSRREARRQAKIDAENEARQAEADKANEDVMEQIRAAQERSNAENGKEVQEQIIIEE